MRRTWWCLKVLLCLTIFLASLLFWTWWSQAPERGPGRTSLFLGTWWSQDSERGPGHWFRGPGVAPPGIDFSSLFSKELPEPPCRAELLLLILVTSQPNHQEARRAIRKTWASPSAGPTGGWQVVFLVGQTLDVEVDWRLHYEQKTSNDLLMGDYRDSYRNLTLKVMHGLSWALDRCHPRYILKTDDDCFVNTQYLPSFLRGHTANSPHLYVGSAFSEQKRAVIRDPLSKWYVSYREYGHNVYPAYASGIGYILSFHSAKSILQTATMVPPIPVEDAYVGVLAQAAGVRLLTSARFAKHNVKWTVCNYRFLMVIHSLSPEDQALAQDMVERTRTSCNHSMEAVHWK